MGIIEQVGHTPLVKIPIAPKPPCLVAAKCEWHNPSGSIKDRAAAAIIQAALNGGELQNRVLIDATSGNTGIAYATFGAALGIPIELALPQNASPERQAILQHFGVKLRLTDPLEGTDGAQRVVQELVTTRPEHYFYANQYGNPNNWKAHFHGTGPEIWAQTEGKITHFVAGLGTTGTFVGTARYLQPKGVKCIAVQPNNPMHGLEGWKHLETAIIPAIYDPHLADEVIQADTDRAYAMARAATRYLGLFLSPSSAANLEAAMHVARNTPSSYVVTIFADNAFKYLSDAYWTNDDYLIDNPFA